MDEQERTIHRGELAGQLLESPVLQEAFSVLRDRNWELYKSTEMADQETREQLWRMSKALDLVEEQLVAFKGIGKFEAAERLEERRKKE